MLLKFREVRELFKAPKPPGLCDAKPYALLYMNDLSSIFLEVVHGEL